MSIYIYINLILFINLTEFSFQSVRHHCPCLRCSLALPAVLQSGPTGIHVAQTLRFSQFIALPPWPFAFKAFSVLNRALATVWRPCALQTTCFRYWIGPRRPRVQKSAVLQKLLCTSFENCCKHHTR